jgi:hypothetical protein
MTRGEAFDVKFVNQRPMPIGARRRIVAPAKGRIDNDTFGQSCRAIARVRRQIIGWPIV